MSTDPYIWIAALLTLGVFSFLIDDNPVFAVCEHLAVGLSAGYMLCIYWNNVLWPELVHPLVSAPSAHASLWVPAAICLLWAAKYVTPVRDLYKLALAFWLSVDLGLAIPTHLDAGVLRQVAGTLAAPWTGSWVAVTGTVVLVFGTVAALAYFYFSAKPHGAVHRVSQVGLWILMIGFGASFAYVILSRVYLLVGRFAFLFHDWLGVL